ncbi:MAG: 4Fe-4S dicluster domain-containing protein [Phycisphaerae bacterium]
MRLAILDEVEEKIGKEVRNLPNAFPPRRTDAPDPEDEPHQVMGFLTDASLCIGCKACEVACKQWNQLPADGNNFTGYSYDNTLHLSETTWRHVAFKEKIGGPIAEAMDDGIATQGKWLMLSDVCKHCEDAPCLKSCPTGSLIYNPFGDVYVQPDICNGCGYCVSACPFGVLGRSEVDGHAHKCTLCFDRQTEGMVPACAKSCPTESIKFGPLDELWRHAEQRIEKLHERGRTDAYLYGKESIGSYGRLNAFFILEDHPNNYNLPEEPRQADRGQVGRYAAGVAIFAGLTAIAAGMFSGGRGSSKKRLVGNRH